MKTIRYLSQIFAALALVLFGLVATLDAPARAAGPWYVSPSGNDTNACNSAAAPCATINGALAKPGFVAGDTVRVASGRYTGTGAQIVLLQKNAVLSGGWGSGFGSQTGYSILDGQLSRQGVVIEDGVTVSIDRFWVEQGAALSPHRGGGIENYGILALTHSVLTNNQESGIANGGWRGIPPVEQVVYNGTLTMDGTVITGNHGWAGGIMSYGTLVISNSSITENLGYSSVGGIYSAGELTINNSTISKNGKLPGSSGMFGEAIHASGGWGFNLLFRINSSTVTQNQGGLTLFFDDRPATLSIQNTILSQNEYGEQPDCLASSVYYPPRNWTITSGGYNIIGSISGCNFSAAPGEQMGVDPKLGLLYGWDAGRRYQTLQPDSPAINAGNPAGCTGSLGAITVDGRGAARSDRCDIGAYEYKTGGVPAALHVLDGAPQHGGVSAVFALPLRAVVVDAAGSPVSDASVLFTAPASGPSVTFSDTGTNTTGATTDGLGIATTPAMTANDQSGAFQVTATAAGLSGQAVFDLTIGAWYVRNGGSDEFDCFTPNSACASIQGVLNKPDFVSGDTILVGAGQYISNTNPLISISKNAVIHGGWDESFVTQSGWSVLDGEQARQIMRIASGTAVDADYLILQNGSRNGNGGGIENNGNLVCSQCVIQKNWASYAGGGLFNSGSARLIDSAVVENSGQVGGGIFNDAATITIENTTVSGNHGRAGAGGGIYTHLGAFRSFSSTISYNVLDNSANSGGGLTSSSPTTLRNTLIFGNISDPAPDCQLILLPENSGYNLIGDSTGCGYLPGMGDLIDVDAHLGPVLGYTLGQRYAALLTDSPAIDAGDPAGCTGSDGLLTSDQRGVSRDAHCDIGAYEYIVPGPAAAIFYRSGSNQHVVPQTAIPLPLQAYVLDAQGSPVENANVTFAAPASGASCTFASSGSRQEIVQSAVTGIATSSTLTANAQHGAYTVTAAAAGVSGNVTFQLANTAWYVAPGGNDGSSCDRPNQACATIGGPMAKPGFYPGDTIRVAVGTYLPVNVDKDAVISGGWNTAFTAQTGYSTIGPSNDDYHILDVLLKATAEVTAERLVITGSRSEGIRTTKHLTLINSAVRFNGFGYYRDAAGIVMSGKVELINVAVFGNQGAGLVVGTNDLTVINSTIVDEIVGFGVGMDMGDIRARNSIFANLIPEYWIDDCPPFILSEGYNLIDDSNCVKTAGTGDLIGVDPGLETFQSLANFLVPDKDSPAIDRGDPNGCLDHLGRPLTFDGRGLPRIGRCDIGAVEVSPLSPSRMTSPQPGLTGGNTVTFRLILQHSAATPLAGVSVYNPLPLLMNYVPNSLQARSGGSSIGGASYSNGVVQWSGAVPAGASVEISYQAIAGAVKGPVVNDAVINAAGHTLRRNLTYTGPICKITPVAQVLPAGPAGSWNAGGVLDPVVLHDANGYRMYFTGINGPRTISTVGLATSQDGVHFTNWGPLSFGGPIYPQNRLGAVVQDGGTYRMWYTLPYDNNFNTQLVTSTDGVNWTPNQQIQIVETPQSRFGIIQTPHVAKIGEVYHIWYVARWNGLGRLHHATSIDGITWVTDKNLFHRLGTTGAWDWLNTDSPHFLNVGDLFQMWYTGWSLPAFSRIGFSSSLRGQDWQRTAAGTLPPGLTASDVGGVRSPWVEADSAGYHIWYTGQDALGNYSISRATGEVCNLLQAGYQAPVQGNQRVHLPLAFYTQPTGNAAPYGDDFSYPTGAWPTGSSASYRSGMYQVAMKSRGMFKALTPIYGKQFLMEISATMANGSGEYGLLFGEYMSAHTEVVIKAGQFAVRRVSDNEEVLIVPWTSHPAINPALNAANRIAILRAGAVLQILINGQVVYTSANNYTGDAYEFQPVGLVVHSAGADLPTVRFDDFRFTPLGEYDQQVFPVQ